MRPVLLLALVACETPSSTSQHAQPVEQYELLDLVGGWRWLHRAAEPGTTRVEDEQWRLRADSAARLVGQYLRTVEVRSTDALPFQCNQRPWYRQRALYDVVVEPEGRDFVVTETGYHAEPSPCEHSFRHLTKYALVHRGIRAELRWDGGSQTLWQTDATPGELTAPWTDESTAEPTGAWRWQTRAYDDDGNVREESEWWDVSRRTDDIVDATYRRRVTVRSIDGAALACAGTPAWSFDDVYLLEGRREEQHWKLTERAVDAGTHPCLATTPSRTLDEATAEQIGDFLVLEWRGKRRQVLYRPD